MKLKLSSSVELLKQSKGPADVEQKKFKFFKLIDKKQKKNYSSWKGGRKNYLFIL